MRIHNEAPVRQEKPVHRTRYVFLAFNLSSELRFRYNVIPKINLLIYKSHR
jgi:hypothetical protein